MYIETYLQTYTHKTDMPLPTFITRTSRKRAILTTLSLKICSGHHLQIYRLKLEVLNPLTILTVHAT